MVANPFRGQLNRENGFVSCVLGSTVPSRVSPRIFYNLAESGAYLRDSTPPSRFPLHFLLEPLCAIGLVSSSSGHAIALPMAFTTENPPAQGQ